MKILHVITSLEIGGAQRLLSDLIPLQIKQGLEVAIAVNSSVRNSFSETIELAGARIINLEESNFYSPLNIFKLRKIIKGFDLIHVHLFPSLYWVALASIGLNVKLVYTEHSTSNSRRSKPYFLQIEKFIYGRYDKIISISSQTQDNLVGWLKESDSRFTIINNGVDISKFKVANQYSAPEYLIMISRFVAAKDQPTVIRAMKYIDSNVKLRFVGDGETLEFCKKLAEEEGVSERIEFMGRRSEIPDLIADSYIGIQSSNWEGFGLTAVEIMASGKPIVASEVDGLKHVVDDVGIIFKKGDELDLANKINRLLSDKNYYDSVAARCSERAKEYDIHKMADNYLKVYQDIYRI